MKLHFEPDLDYQHTAIEAVCGLFCGQEICRTDFTVVRDADKPQQRMSFFDNDVSGDTILGPRRLGKARHAVLFNSQAAA